MHPLLYVGTEEDDYRNFWYFIPRSFLLSSSRLCGVIYRFHIQDDGLGGSQSAGYIETFEDRWTDGCLISHSSDLSHSFRYFRIPNTSSSNPQYRPVPFHSPWNWDSTFPPKRRNEPGTLYGVKSRNTDIFRMTTRAMFRKFISTLSVICGTLLVAQLVEALRYKPEGRGFDSRWCHWNFSVT